MRVFIRINHTDEVIPLDVSRSVTVKELKTKIHEKSGIPSDQQLLDFRSKVVSSHFEGYNLSDMNVDPESTIHLYTNYITIQVKTSASDGFLLRVKDEISVNSVKQLISLRTGILMDSQVLLWNDRKLRDNEILNECDIEDNSVLQLLSYLSGDTYKV